MPNVFGQVEKWTRDPRVHDGRYNVVSIVDTPGAPRTPPRSPRRKSFSGDDRRAREQPPRPKRRKWLGRAVIVFAVLALALLVRGTSSWVDRGGDMLGATEGESPRVAWSD